MVILITGASHSGKTYLAQKLLERYHFPCLSIDHLKMGLIRSGQTLLTPMSDDDDLTAYLWPIVVEMIKTAIENDQNLIVEGCYIPYDWSDSLEKSYLDRIRFLCLVMTRRYIETHFAQIKAKASIIENRLDDEWCTMESVIADNEKYLPFAQKYQDGCILIDEEYRIPFEKIDQLLK